jgi:hypothetical protein
MLVLSRVLVLLLLAIDWVEDTHFGHYLFSRAMASSDVSPLDTGFQEGKIQRQEAKSLGTCLLVMKFESLPIRLTPTIPNAEKSATSDRSQNAMYAFMSLQL